MPNVSQLARSTAVGITVLVVLAVSCYRWARTHSRSALLLLFGAICFVMVAFAHLAEALRWFPSMGWGAPHSVGHYIDLTSALLGMTLTVAALIAWALRSEATH